MTDVLESPFEVLGIPKPLVVEARISGEYAVLADMARELRKAWSRIYRPDRADIPADHKDRWLAIQAAVDRLVRKGGAESAAKMWLRDGDLDGHRAGATSQRQIVEAREIQRRLAVALYNVNPLAVLKLAKPARFAAAIGQPGELGGHVSLLLGDATASSLRLQLARQAARDPMDGQLILTEPPDYVPEQSAWVTSYQFQDSPLDTDPEGPLPEAKGSYRWQPSAAVARCALVGGVPSQTLQAELAKQQRSARIPAAVALPASDSRSDGLAWVPQEHAWWLRLLQPTVGAGDFVVLLQSRPMGLQFAVTGPLLAVETK